MARVRMFLKYLKLKCPIKDINEVVQEETHALLRITQMERRPHLKYPLQPIAECQLHKCKTVTLKYLLNKNQPTYKNHFNI